MRRLLVLCALLLPVAVSCGDDETATTSGSPGSEAPTGGPEAPDPTPSPDPAPPTEAPTPSTTEVAPPASHPTAEGGVAITGYETSFGMCAGWCRQTLTFDGPDVALEASDRMDDRSATSTGVLTDEGVVSLAQVAAAVSPSEVDEVYGCPDCADGGAASLTFTSAGGTTTTTYDFGGPPPELTDADALGAAVLEAMRTCTSNEIVVVDDGCTPLER